MCIELARASVYFNNQTESFLSKLAEISKKKILNEGEVIVNEGEKMENFFIFESGLLERTKRKHLNIEDQSVTETIVIDKISKSSKVVGLLHVLAINGDPAYATIIVKETSTIWVIEREDFMNLLNSDNEHSIRLMGTMAVLLRSTSKVLRALKHGDADFEGVKIICFDTTNWVRSNFTQKIEAYNKNVPENLKMMIDFTTDTLSSKTSHSAVNHDIACLFVNDTADKSAILGMSNAGIKMIAMRCAGFDRVDCETAKTLGITVARVPSYSPYAVAEHGIALLLSLNRKLYKAIPRVNDFNFALDGLIGFDMHGKTVGVIGTGQIGVCLCNILIGFGVKLLCYDIRVNEDLCNRGAEYKDIDYLWANCDVIFLMTPLFPSTYHIFNDSVLSKLKKGMLLINTSRGGLIDTVALIKGLKSGVVGGAGLDVYENEAGYFFRDCSDTVLADDKLVQLLSFNNVVLTAHQAFFTQDAIDNIVDTTIENIKLFIQGKTCQKHPNSVY